MRHASYTARAASGAPTEAATAVIRPTSGGLKVSGRKPRWLTAGLFASAGAGMLALTSMMNPFVRCPHADDPDIGLVVGGSGLPIPGPDYVEAADWLYINAWLSRRHHRSRLLSGHPATDRFGERRVHARGAVSAVSAPASTNCFATTR